MLLFVLVGVLVVTVVGVNVSVVFVVGGVDIS